MIGKNNLLARVALYLGIMASATQAQATLTDHLTGNRHRYAAALAIAATGNAAHMYHSKLLTKEYVKKMWQPQNRKNTLRLLLGSVGPAILAALLELPGLRSDKSETTLLATPLPHAATPEECALQAKMNAIEKLATLTLPSKLNSTSDKDAAIVAAILNRAHQTTIQLDPDPKLQSPLLEAEDAKFHLVTRHKIPSGLWWLECTGTPTETPWTKQWCELNNRHARHMQELVREAREAGFSVIYRDLDQDQAQSPTEPFSVLTATATNEKKAAFEEEINKLDGWLREFNESQPTETPKDIETALNKLHNQYREHVWITKLFSNDLLTDENGHQICSSSGKLALKEREHDKVSTPRTAYLPLSLMHYPLPSDKADYVYYFFYHNATVRWMWGSINTTTPLTGRVASLTMAYSDTLEKLVRKAQKAFHLVTYNSEQGTFTVLPKEEHYAFFKNEMAQLTNKLQECTLQATNPVSAENLKAALNAVDHLYNTKVWSINWWAHRLIVEENGDCKLFPDTPEDEIRHLYCRSYEKDREYECMRAFNTPQDTKAKPATTCYATTTQHYMAAMDNLFEAAKTAGYYVCFNPSEQVGQRFTVISQTMP